MSSSPVTDLDPEQPGTVRAAVLVAPGEPVAIQEFPYPRIPMDGAVVRVAYAGICGTDIHLRSGHLAVPCPVVMGHEAVGTIAELSSGLTHDLNGEPLVVGDRVVWTHISCGRCYECLVLKERTLCTSRQIYGINRTASQEPHLFGGMADYVALTAGTPIIKIPDDVTFEEVVTLGCAGPTAVHGMEYLTILPGDTVVVQGAGPVGLASAMYAKLMGAGEVVLIGGPTARLEQAQSVGACTQVVDMAEVSTPEDRLAAVQRLTRGGKGADVVIECAGVPTAVAESLDLVRPSGQVLVLGQYTDHGATPLNPHLITKKQMRLSGSWGFSEAHYVKYVNSLRQLKERHDLQSLLTVFPLSEADRAMDAVAAGETTKAALRP